MEMVKRNINYHRAKFDHHHSFQNVYKKLLCALIDSAWLFHTWACQSALDLPRPFTLLETRSKGGVGEWG